MSKNRGTCALPSSLETLKVAVSQMCLALSLTGEWDRDGGLYMSHVPNDYYSMVDITKVKKKERLPGPRLVGESLFSCLSKFSMGNIILCWLVRINKMIIIPRI